MKVLPKMGPLTTIDSHIRCRYDSGEALYRRESATSRLISGFCFDLHDDCCKLHLQVSSKHPLLHLLFSIVSVWSTIYLVPESFCATVSLVNHPFVAFLHNSFSTTSLLCDDAALSGLKGLKLYTGGQRARVFFGKQPPFFCFLVSLFFFCSSSFFTDQAPPQPGSDWA